MSTGVSFSEILLFQVISHGLQLSFGVLLVILLRRWDPEYAATASEGSSSIANPYSAAAAAASYVSPGIGAAEDGSLEIPGASSSSAAFVTVSSSSVVSQSDRWIQAGRHAIKPPKNFFPRDFSGVKRFQFSQLPAIRSWQSSPARGARNNAFNGLKKGGSVTVSHSASFAN